MLTSERANDSIDEAEEKARVEARQRMLAGLEIVCRPGSMKALVDVGQAFLREPENM
jgi:hypothetical protein